MKKLIKSYKFWTALAGSIGLLFATISEHIGIYINAEGVKEIIMAFCGVLIVFGVVKKPQKLNKPQEIDLRTTQEQNQNSNDTNNN